MDETNLNYCNKLSKIEIDSFDDYKIINPYNDINKEQIKCITKKFYNIFYSDNKKRRFLLDNI